MLSQYYISEAIPEEISDLASQMEADLILAVAEELGGVQSLSYAEYISTRAALLAATAAIGASYWKRAQRELGKTFLEAATKSLEADERILQRGAKAGLLRQAPPLAESNLINQLIGQQYNATRDRLYRVWTRAQNVPIGVLDSAFRSVQSGTVTLQKAVETAVSDLAGRGITVAVYPRPGGKQMQMELAPYVRQIVRTSVGQSTKELTFQRMREYGADLILISSHAGARPLCEPWQGKIYSLSGTHKIYPPFSSTSYGLPGGLFGVNCGHASSVWTEGLSRLPTPDDRDPSKAAGRSNTADYEASQHQRYLERKLRAWKRKSKALEEAGLDNTRARAKAREWSATMKRFIAESGRTRRPYREKVL